MKKFLISCFTVTFVFFIACQGNSAKKVNSSNANSTSSSAPAKKATGGPAMTFDKTSHDFGIISEGEKVTTTFGFTNTGDSDLIIVDARGSCGCTVPDYPKDKEIQPGESGVIKARFDSSGQTGKQVKSITLTTNTENSKKIIRMSGFVVNK